MHELKSHAYLKTLFCGLPVRWLQQKANFRKVFNINTILKYAMRDVNSTFNCVETTCLCNTIYDYLCHVKCVVASKLSTHSYITQI